MELPGWQQRVCVHPWNPMFESEHQLSGSVIPITAPLFPIVVSNRQPMKQVSQPGRLSLALHCCC